MSFTAARISRRTRAVCQRCRDRKARVETGGAVRADRDRTQCFECFRAERERQRAGTLAGRAAPAGLPFLRPGASPAEPATSRHGGGQGDALRSSPPHPAVLAVAGANGSDPARRLAHRRRMLAHLEGHVPVKTGA
jgi:hypothetical protein